MILHNDGGETKQSTVYSWKSDTVNVAGTVASTNITGITGFTDLFDPFNDAVPKRRPHKIKIEVDGAAYAKINGGDVITLSATDPFEAEDLIIESLYVSSGGSGITMTVYLQ